MNELRQGSVTAEEWKQLTQRPMTMDENVLKFLEVAIAEQWEQGTALTRAAMAEKLDWSRNKLTRVIRAIKETPDYGISISTKRGTYPVTVVSFEGDPLPDESVGKVSRISESAQRENLHRMVRSATTSFVAYNHANKTRTEARRMKPYVERMRSFLLTLHEQAVSDDDPYGIIATSETALALVGVRFDGDGSAV